MKQKLILIICIVTAFSMTQCGEMSGNLKDGYHIEGGSGSFHRRDELKKPVKLIDVDLSGDSKDKK